MEKPSEAPPSYERSLTTNVLEELPTINVASADVEHTCTEARQRGYEVVRKEEQLQALQKDLENAIERKRTVTARAIQKQTETEFCVIVKKDRFKYAEVRDHVASIKNDRRYKDKTFEIELFSNSS